MIRNFEFYHGAALARLIHSTKPVKIRLYPSGSNASYVVNETIALYLKHSANRMSPWNFSFQKEHQNEIFRLKKRFGDVVLGLICNDDGIVGLTYEELKSIFWGDRKSTEWVSVSRKQRHEYSVKGKDGKLKHKVGHQDFLTKVLKSI